MKRTHENHRGYMAAIALVAAMTLGPAAAMASPCAAPAGQGACTGACAATAASAGCLYAQTCLANDAQIDCPRAGARAAWLEGTCNALRCRSTRSAQVAGDWAAQRQGAFVDEDGDGVCDNAQNCARANGDRPRLGAGYDAGNGTGMGNGAGNGTGLGNGAGYGNGCVKGVGCGYGMGAVCAADNGMGASCDYGDGSAYDSGATCAAGTGCGYGAGATGTAGNAAGQGAHHGWGGGRR